MPETAATTIILHHLLDALKTPGAINPALAAHVSNQLRAALPSHGTQATTAEAA